MNALVTDSQIASYQRDGVVVLRNLLDSRWLDTLADGIAENLRNPSPRTTTYTDDPVTGERFFFDARILGEVGAYDQAMLDSPMAEAVGRLMGSSRAVLYYVTVFVRSPGTHARTPWHQDQPSWSASGDQACSLWLSLDKVPRETALEFVRGSHRWETDYRRPAFFNTQHESDEQAKLSAFPDIETHRNDYEILAWDLEPGDCLVFHGMTAHGGSGNLPPGLGRRSLSIQWLGDDARFRLLPDHDDPRISEELLRRGVRPGEPVISDMCPVAWPRP